VPDPVLVRAPPVPVIDPETVVEVLSPPAVNVYELNETVPAPGYQLDGTTYTYNIGGTALFKEGTVNVMDSVTDALTPPSITTTTLTVAALTEEVESEDSAGIIDVLGIQELPFTGTNAIILFSGIIILLAGMAVLSAHLRRNTSK